MYWMKQIASFEKKLFESHYEGRMIEEISGDKDVGCAERLSDSEEIHFVYGQQ